MEKNKLINTAVFSYIAITFVLFVFTCYYVRMAMESSGMTQIVAGFAG
ncbi:hypothetical protein IKA15_05940 [bacterium]|nr:hypothetical protein [bacterium]